MLLEQLVKRLVEQERHNPHYEGTPDPPPGEYEVAEGENQILRLTLIWVSKVKENLGRTKKQQRTGRVSYCAQTFESIEVKSFRNVTHFQMTHYCVFTEETLKCRLNNSRKLFLWGNIREMLHNTVSHHI